MTRLASLLLVLWGSLIVTAGDARADRMVALVIGNSAYQNTAAVADAAKDADAIAALFRSAGFDIVETKRDLGNLDMKTAMRDFASVVRGADVAVVYFSGHGIAVNGTNYLLPVDAKLASDFDVEDEALSLDRLMRSIEPAKRARLVILDAARDNSFVSAMKRSVSAEAIGGLAQVNVTAPGTMVAIAAQPGALAQDGRSVFTAALLNKLMAPDRNLRTALDDVRDEVRQMTAGRQEPLIAGWIEQSGFSLAASPAAATSTPTRQITVLPSPNAPPPAPPSEQVAADPQRDFEAAERIGTIEAWDAFLSVHPAGFYAALARTHRAKLVTPGEKPGQPQITTLSAPSNTVEQPITTDPRAVARELQAELRRVGCDPGASDGDWTARSRSALQEFNRRAGMTLDVATPSLDALEAGQGQRGRICPLACGSGQRVEGDRCVAIPAAPVKPAKKTAAVPERSRKAEPPARSRNAEPPPARRAAPPPPREARQERIRPPTDREIFGGGGPAPVAPPLSIGIGGRGLGIGFGF